MTAQTSGATFDRRLVSLTVTPQEKHSSATPRQASHSRTFHFVTLRLGLKSERCIGVSDRRSPRSTSHPSPRRSKHMVTHENSIVGAKVPCISSEVQMLFKVIPSESRLPLY